MTQLRSYFRPYLSEVAPYVGVERIDTLAVRYGLAPDAVSKLDANENPYGPSPLVYEALGSLRDANRYPDPLASELRERIAGYAGVEVSNLLVGAGADEILEQLVRLFVDPGEITIDAPPTFSMYPVFTVQNAGRSLQVPRGERWEVDVPGMLDAVGPGVKLIWVCSPNNPTGNVTPQEDIVALLETGVPVVVDEAYYEFSGKTCLPLLSKYPNLIITRTFSKLAGLAGMRVGYVLAHEEVIAEMLKIKQPYNVTIAGQVAALASLQDLDRLKENVDKIVRERDRMAELLREHGELTPYPSEANYLLCRAQGDPQQLKADLAARGVFVRHFAKSRIDGCLRISAGAPEDTDRLMSALEELRPLKVGASA